MAGRTSRRPEKPRRARTAILTDYIRAAMKVDRLAAGLMAPYLAWVGFAGVLNGSMVRRNRWA